MSYSTTIQLTLFQNLDSTGKAEGKPTYGYRIFSDFGIAEYCNAFNSISELLDEVSSEVVLDFIRENHTDLYENIQTDGGFVFNDEEIDLDDEECIEEDAELFDGDDEIQEEVGEVLEEAANQLI